GSSPFGATGPKSTTCALDAPAGCTTMKPMPPSPLFHGSRVARAKAVATAASTALPPAARMPAPISAAAPFCEATMPPRDAIPGLRITQFWIAAIGSGRPDRIDAGRIERVVAGEPGHLVIRGDIAPDRVLRRFRGASVDDLDRPVRGVALERAIGRMLGLLEEVEAHVLFGEIVDRAVAGLLDAQRLAAVGDDRAAESDAQMRRIGVDIDAMLGLLGPTGGGIGHQIDSLASMNPFGGGRPLRVDRRGALAAIERGDAAVVKFRALQRAALLRDTGGAEFRVAAGELVVLLALANIALRRGVGRILRPSRRRQPQRHDRRR